MLNSIIRLPLMTAQFQNAVRRSIHAKNLKSLEQEASATLRNEGVNEENCNEFFDQHLNHLETVNSLNENARVQLMDKARNEMTKNEPVKRRQVLKNQGASKLNQTSNMSINKISRIECNISAELAKSKQMQSTESLHLEKQNFLSVKMQNEQMNFTSLNGSGEILLSQRTGVESP